MAGQGRTRQGRAGGKRGESERERDVKRERERTGFGITVPPGNGRNTVELRRCHAPENGLINPKYTHASP